MDQEPRTIVIRYRSSTLLILELKLNLLQLNDYNHTWTNLNLNPSHNNNSDPRNNKRQRKRKKTTPSYQDQQTRKERQERVIAKSHPRRISTNVYTNEEDRWTLIGLCLTKAEGRSRLKPLLVVGLLLHTFVSHKDFGVTLRPPHLITEFEREKKEKGRLPRCLLTENSCGLISRYWWQSRT